MRWRGRVGFPRAAGRVVPPARLALRRARAATASRHASAGADAGAFGLLVLVARADACAAQPIRVERAVLHGDISYTRPSPSVRRRWNQALIARRRSAALAPSIVARPRRSARWRAVFEGVLPVVGSTPFIPLISYVFTFPKHLHQFLLGEARTV